MISFAYSPAVYDGTNASLTSAVSANGWPEIGKRYRIPPRCTANLRMALAAIGLSVPLVPDPFNLWMNIPIMPDGATSFEPTVLSAGDRFDMRALADCIAVMSACPQNKNPINGHDAVPSEFLFIFGA